MTDKPNFWQRGRLIFSISDLETRTMVHCNTKSAGEEWRIYFHTHDLDLAVIEVFGSRDWKNYDDLSTISGRVWRERRDEILMGAGGIIKQWPRLRDLPADEREPFSVWLRSQTIPGIEGLSASEQDCYYPWDYQAWKTGLPASD